MTKKEILKQIEAKALAYEKDGLKQQVCYIIAEDVEGNYIGELEEDDYCEDCIKDIQEYYNDLLKENKHKQFVITNRDEQYDTRNVKHFEYRVEERPETDFIKHCTVCGEVIHTEVDFEESFNLIPYHKKGFKDMNIQKLSNKDCYKLNLIFERTKHKYPDKIENIINNLLEANQ